MESENLYQHHQQQLQLQLVYSSLPSSSSTSPPTVQEWNPSSIVLGNGDEFNRYMNEILPNSKEYFWPKCIDLVPSVKRSILEVDYDTKPSEFRTYVHPLQFDDNTPPPKGSLSDCFLKLCDTNVGILNNGYIKNGQEQDLIDLNQNLWISSFSDIGPMKQQKLPEAEVFAGLVPCPPPSYMSSCSGSTTDHQHHSLFASTSLLPSSATTLPLPTHNMKGRNYDNEDRLDQASNGERMPSGYSQVQQPCESPSNSSNKTSTFRRDARRKNKISKPTNEAASDDEVAKKPRVVPPNSSCPTLKVRKEKLGDRIAALHRMVSPFGKTDTASVLTEAIGYIQFLQDQILTLSLSYFKSSRDRWCQTTRGGRLSMKEWKDEEEQKTQDLRSRGLCLVPLAFTSYMCSYDGSIY